MSNANGKTCERKLEDGTVCGSSDMASNHSWCKKCKADYQRGYEETKINMLEGKGFQLGVTAMRKMLADEFNRLPAGGILTCAEVAHAILFSPGPAYLPYKMETLSAPVA